MYISHDEILGAFYRALGWDHVKGALPASSLYIEFYRSQQQPAQKEARFLGVTDTTNDIKVRIFFNDTAGQPGVPVTLYTDPTKTGVVSTLQQFKDMIDKQIKSYQFAGQILDDVCNNNSYQYKTDYMDPSQWKADMNKIYTALTQNAVKLTTAIVGVIAVVSTFLM